MKKLLIVLLAMLCVLPLFAKSYSEYLAEAKKYESQKRWCYALDSYYDAMGTDEPPENKLEAYEGYNSLKTAILSGNPGLGKFNEFTIHDEWKNLLIDAEKYGSNISIYDITIGDLYKGALDYETRTATYRANVSYNLSDRYNKTISIIEEGYKAAYKKDWTDLPKEWPLYSASSKHNSTYNVSGALVYAMESNSMEYFNAFKWVGTAPSSVKGMRLYDYKVNIVDENGKELVKGKRWLLGDGWQISFSGITPELMDIIDAGKAFVNPVGCYLQYGKYNSADDKGGRTFMKNFPEVQLPMDKMVFICWNNEADKIAANFSVAADYTNEFNAVNNIELVNIDDLQVQILKTEVTQVLYRAVMGENPSSFRGDNLPVEKVSWFDSIYFCNKLSEKKGFTPVYSVNGSTNSADWNYTPHKGESIDGIVEQNKFADGFRLPTEEEWGYAAKGGEDYEYAGSDNLDEVGWYYENSAYNGINPVAQKKANGYGLYDMSGNVWEWCWDNRYSGRVIRGGCWASDNSYCIVNYRSSENPDSVSKYRGFRVVRSSSEQIAEKQKIEENLQIAKAENREMIIDNIELVNAYEYTSSWGRTVDIQVLATEVTQALYKAVMGENPSEFMGDDLPVESVSWYDAIYFCNRLSEIKGLTPVYSVNGSTDTADWNYTPHKKESIMSDVQWDKNADGYRLPTGAEWYIAAKGGVDYIKFAGSDNLKEVAWYEYNSGSRTCPVAQKKANGYGLYDMSGNVWEWTWDEEIVYKDRETNYHRIYGGSWNSKSDQCECVSWTEKASSSSSNTVGFRIVRTIK